MVGTTERSLRLALGLLALVSLTHCAQGSPAGSGPGGSGGSESDALGSGGNGGADGAAKTGSGGGGGAPASGGAPGIGGTDGGSDDALADNRRDDGPAPDAAGDRAPIDVSKADGAAPACERMPTLRLTTVATANRPIHLVGHPSDPGTILLAERDGAIRTLKGTTLGTTPVVTVQTKTDAERGLLSLALHPDDPSRLFAFYIASNNDSVVQEFARTGDTAAPGRIHYRNAHANGYHQGGSIAFGADKMLYISIGDNQTDGGPVIAQQIDSRYGKILRVDPATGMAAAGNPSGFTWSYGLRNPWRIAFDRLTGDLYIADVGEDHEEVNFEPRGASGRNYAWGGNGTEGEALRYGRSCIIGGHVYRGKKIACMQGRYLFKDRLSGVGQSFAIAHGRATDARQHAMLSGAGLYSFGEDGDGELYMLFENGRVARIDADATAAR